MTPKDAPTMAGWHWYREYGTNLNEPMPAWVFDTRGILYACRMAQHEPAEYHAPVRVEHCAGRWLGPVELPI